MWNQGNPEETVRRRPAHPPLVDMPQSENDLYASMCRFFDEEEWPYLAIEGESAVKLSCTGNNGEWTCYSQIREEPARFLFYSVYNAKALEPRRAAVAEFITRVNYGMVLGNFEMDFTDGEIRYKTSAYLQSLVPAKDFYHTLVYTNLLVTDKYLPGLMSVIYAGMAPEQAVDHAGG